MKRLTLATALLLLSSWLGGPQLFAQQIQINAQNRTIAISTSEEASAPADRARVQIGFQTFGKDQDATYADAARTSNAIVKALTDAGIAKESIESSGQSLRPLTQNSEDDRAHYAEGQRFAFSQSWGVTVAADQAARALQIAVSNGANDSGGITWTLQDRQSLEAEAASRALAHAHQIASSMAQGLGAKLGQLIYASNQAPPEGLAPRALFNAMSPGAGRNLGGGVMRLKGAPLALTPERITESATVYAVFAIE